MEYPTDIFQHHFCFAGDAVMLRELDTVCNVRDVRENCAASSYILSERALHDCYFPAPRSSRSEMETAASPRGDRCRRAQHSFRMAASRSASNTGEPVENPHVEDKIFVAVPEDLKSGKSTLMWALQNLAKHSSMSRIIIAHVHSPAQMISSKN